jgi:hypothetical protein
MSQGERLLSDAISSAQRFSQISSSVAALYFYLGGKDKGFEWFEKAYSMKQDLEDLKWDHAWDTIRTDSRYFDLLRRLGFDSVTK